VYCNNPKPNLYVKIFDLRVAKSIEFILVEMLRLAPNSPPQARKIVKLRHFYVIVIQKNAIVTQFRKNSFRKNSKNRILQYLATRRKLQYVKNYFTIPFLFVEKSSFPTPAFNDTGLQRPLSSFIAQSTHKYVPPCRHAPQ
jgi:hypothetical protein